MIWIEDDFSAESGNIVGQQSVNIVSLIILLNFDNKFIHEMSKQFFLSSFSRDKSTEVLFDFGNSNIWNEATFLWNYVLYQFFSLQWRFKGG